MKRKLGTRAGAKVYAPRKGLVEPLLGQIKQGRGRRGVLFPGWEKVRGEEALICLPYNILKRYTRDYG